MRPPLAEQLDHLARRCLPFAMTLVLVIVGAVPVPVTQYADIAPAVALMAVYYWTVYRGDLMPAAAVFAIGVLVDILAGTPLGLTALVWLVAYAIAASQRRYLHDKSFFLQWLGFLVFAASAGALKWVLVSILSDALIDPRPLAFQFIMTIVLYPCMAWLLLKTQLAFLRQV